jgi:hypothetical protein
LFLSTLFFCSLLPLQQQQQQQQQQQHNDNNNDKKQQMYNQLMNVVIERLEIRIYILEFPGLIIA